MKAYFCDRCGKAYPIRNKVSLNAWRVDENGKFSKRKLGCDGLLDVDLCPRCIVSLDKWLNNIEEDKE